MPPRGGRGQTEEVKKANFDNYMESEEHKFCTLLFKARKEGDHELVKLGAGTDDIIDDWQPILTSLY